MIIRKKDNNNDDAKATPDVPFSGAKIIKAQKVNPLKLKAEAKKEKKIADIKTPPLQEKKVKAQPQKQKTLIEQKVEEYEKIDVTDLEFKERYERRRGERRRGFRRIDERTLVSRAQEEAQNIREIAAREGYKNGLMEAEAELDNLKASLNEFIDAKKEVYEQMSSHILELAVEAAKKIIKKEVELSGDILKNILSEVFDELGSTDEKITVKVNTEDVEFAKASLPEILSNSVIDAKINVVGDDLIEKGSCTVIANNGVVDANFSTQLSVIQAAFGIYTGGE